MIYRRPEGNIVRNGFNWDRNDHSTIVIVFKLWVFNAYLRLRAKHIGKPRLIAGFGWNRWYTGRGFVDFDFDTRTFKIAGGRISWEALEDLVSRARQDFPEN